MRGTLRVLPDAEAELQSAAMWVVFFRMDSSTIEIVAVAHAKRRPGYWLDRRRSVA